MWDPQVTSAYKSRLFVGVPLPISGLLWGSLSTSGYPESEQIYQNLYVSEAREISGILPFASTPKFIRARSKGNLSIVLKQQQQQQHKYNDSKYRRIGASDQSTLQYKHSLE
jgi:hypothetical protein